MLVFHIFWTIFWLVVLGSIPPLGAILIAYLGAGLAETLGLTK